jgi:hypothetical protein
MSGAGGETRDDGDPLERENRERGGDPVWVNQFTVLALLLAAVGGVGIVLAMGWRPDYPLSVVAALVAAVVGLGTQLVVISYLPGARVHRLDAILLLSSAVFAGMVLVSAESGPADTTSPR